MMHTMVLVDAYAAASHLSVITGCPVTPATIRQWATRGHVRRHGRDRRGRTLYDLDELQDHVTGNPAHGTLDH